MTSRRTWQKMESKTAGLLNGKRALASGAAHEDRTDVEHPDFTVSCKLRAKMVVWTDFKEVEKRAKKAGKTPLLILKEKGKHGELAVVRMEYLKELLEKAEGMRGG